jgi:hypothetical protein
LLRSRGLIVAALLAAACAAPPEKREERKPPPQPLPALPATFINEPDCPGCLGVTLTLRPDGSYLVRDQLGASEFYDFGRWRYADGTLELAGDRGNRRFQLNRFKRNDQVERLRGPFRMVGVYDGAMFKECRTGLAWKLAETRAAENLQAEVVKAQGHPVLVALDAQLEGTPEMLRVLRPAAVLDARGCPS